MCTTQERDGIARGERAVRRERLNIGNVCPETGWKNQFPVTDVEQDPEPGPGNDIVLGSLRGRRVATRNVFVNQTAALNKLQRSPSGPDAPAQVTDSRSRLLIERLLNT
ncbi:hypothetical protein EVAR_38852_1 [Eumeta japonica]|uniref:Uncharacterized protein n=1 Tax=Eumeta variegata TaxID=151549 RepID=A0A4C1X634_EUMVA|nr:hypothetical protein EVAR_38852_1 [Eumeta japonica]